MVYHSLTLIYFFSKPLLGGSPSEKVDTKFECFKFPQWGPVKEYKEKSPKCKKADDVTKHQHERAHNSTHTL